MTKYNSKQKGMTFIGIVIMFMFIGVLMLAVLKVFPLYYENNGLQTALTGFTQEYNDKPGMTPAQMVHVLQARFDGQEVYSIKGKDVIIKRSRSGYTVDASYKAVANFMGNLNFMVEFDHVIELEK